MMDNFDEWMFTFDTLKNDVNKVLPRGSSNIIDKLSTCCRAAKYLTEMAEYYEKRFSELEMLCSEILDEDSDPKKEKVKKLGTYAEYGRAK